MGIDVHVHDTYISFSLWELAFWALSTVVVVGAALAVGEILHRRLKSSRSN